ncbi:MAG: hypothetical protein FWC55_04670 [Firmicutes bacterium]|nr:hypothetical protein [Bacillota bacterium]
MSKTNEQAYRDRLRRYVTAMNRGVPDRIPIRFFLQEAAARFQGVTNQEVALDYQSAFDVTRRTAAELGIDAVMLNAIWSNYGVGKAAGWRYLAVPGVDVAPDSVNQFSEPVREEDMFLQAGEYGEFIDDPTAFLFTKWLPRAAARVRFAGEPVDFDHNLSLISGALAYAGYMSAFGPAAARLRAEGIVSANSGMIKAPLDIMADKFRGYVNVCLDAADCPDKLFRACEALMPHILANALASADPDRQVPVTLWAHRGCVPYISMEMFDRVFWPTLKPVLEEIIRRGHQVLFYGEGNWEAHYGRLLELPEGGIVYHLDRGDPIEAARKLKHRFAVSGGLSYDVLSRGSTDDVKKHMNSLFEVMKPDGGYILDASALMLSDVKPGNLRAAADYTMEHGVYSRTFPAKPMGKPESGPPIPGGKRPPGTCRPWETEKAGYRNLCGDTEKVESSWKAADSAAYYYMWTTVLW